MGGFTRPIARFGFRPLTRLVKPAGGRSTIATDRLKHNEEPKTMGGAKRPAGSPAEAQVTIAGRAFENIAVAAAVYGVPVRRVRRRLRKGWTAEQAVGLH